MHISKIDPIGRSIIYFMHFKQVESPFGFLYLDTVEKNGKIIPKSYFSKAGFLQKTIIATRDLYEVTLLPDIV